MQILVSEEIVNKTCHRKHGTVCDLLFRYTLRHYLHKIIFNTECALKLLFEGKSKDVLFVTFQIVYQRQRHK